MTQIYFLSNDNKEIDKVMTGLETKFSIENFENLQTFLQQFLKAPPQVLILDHEFPGLNIAQFIAKIKEKPELSEIPIIILTTTSQRAEIINCIKLGVKDFLLKPYLINALLTKIKNFINGPSSSSLGTVQDGNLNVVAEEKRKKAILREIDNLPAFPMIVQEVIRIASDRNSSAGDFEKYVSKDQTLTAKMLRMANSSFYNLNRDVILIRDAVVTLGYKTVKSIAFAAGTGDIFKKNLPQYGLAPGGLWKHSLGCAIACRTVGIEFEMGDDLCEELFVCGLLHDIGKLVLGMFISREDKVYLAPETGVNNICQLEKKLTGFDHSELGEKIVEKWKLPEIILYAIKYHHKPDESTMYSKEVAIVNLSNYICSKLRIGFSRKNVLEPKLLDSVKRELDLNDAKLDKVLNLCEENLKEIDKIAGI